MFGTIAKKLRIFGFDCKYYSTIEDNSLILIAKNENRIIITRDQQLVAKCKKQNIAIIGIFNSTEKEQIIELARKMNWKRFDLTISNARCSLCNGFLQSISKQQTINKIPEKVAEFVSEFWRCETCEKIYWVGTHIKNLELFISEINDKL